MNILVGCEESQSVCIEMRAKGHKAFSCDLLSCSGGKPEWHFKMDVFKAINAGVLITELGESVFIDKWDLGIFFPTCTYLTCSAEWAYKEPPYHQKLKPGTLFGSDRVGARVQASNFFKDLYNCKIQSVVIENPVGIMSSYFRKPDQVIQPWQFGDNASKSTCLWLKNIHKLQHTEVVPPQSYSLVKCADEMIMCECCEEPYCEVHDEHYAECDCIGPTQDEATYKTIAGYDFATLVAPAPNPVWGNQTPSGQNKLPPSADRAKLRSKTYPGIAKAMADQWG